MEENTRTNKAKEAYIKVRAKRELRENLDEQLVKLYNYFESRFELIEEELLSIKKILVSKDDYSEITIGANRKFEPDVEYISKITYVNEIGDFNFLNKKFTKYLVQLDGCKDYFEIVRESNISKLKVGLVIKHRVTGTNIRPYNVIKVD